MRYKLLALLVASLTLSASALAQDKACSKADAARAEKAIDSVTTFAQMHKAWQDWKHCDSGPVAEVFNDALFRLLVDWKGLDGLASSVGASADYKAWMLARVKAASKEDKSAIFSRAKTGCPSKHSAMCEDLIAASSDSSPSAAPAPGTAPANPAK
jgi:hypothetical protein